MNEIELKFQIPVPARAAVRRGVATPAAQVTRLRARYYDTPDGHLARAGVAPRLRLEGDVWVQTLKAPGSGPQRLEHEVVLAETGDDVHLDPARHAGHAAGDRLSAALDGRADQLMLRFETDVQRCHRLMRCEGASIEVALDVGQIRAGDAVLDLHEIEFELKSGALQGLFVLAQRWQQRHGLWLDTRSKAERGDLLLRGLGASPPASARQPLLREAMSPDQALRLMVGACLDQVLPNASAVAGGVGEPEHLHQARVGLRRLRTALRVFGAWSDAMQGQWPAQAAALFARLGAARDRDVLVAALLPQLRQAGAPAGLEIDTAAAADVDDAAAALREPAAGALWIELMSFAHGSPAGPATDAPFDLSRLALPLVDRLQRRLHVDASNFGALDDVQRHTTRKRLKRLRYALELVGSLCRPKALRRSLKRLQPAQAALGDYNDLVVAAEFCQAWADREPHAWFVVGWCAAKQTQALSHATAVLAEFKPAHGLARRSRQEAT
ncbi:MAG: CYTH and CHAD domain-containing protein [Burkholderiales bacterium]|nr:CYTH and CHAD domain-containing protein [Burkholderiales bacterium]